MVDTASHAYADCRVIDLRLLWIRRVWEFFRDKYDQRNEARTGEMLVAADEVVWSCYSQPLDRLKAFAPNLSPQPPPLPYLETRYSPEAFPAELVPSSLKSEVDADFLRRHLHRLPISVVRLPPACVEAPWWLVYLGHEVGHHIAAQLFTPERRQAVLDAVGGDDGERARWERWAGEVFADVYSVLMMGPAAVWSMVELEMGSQAQMSTPRTAYPSPAVRLLLLPRPQRISAFRTRTSWIDAREHARRHSGSRPRSHARPPFREGGAGDQDPRADAPPDHRLRWRVVAEGCAADRWRARLLRAADGPGETTVGSKPAARQLISGAVAAWSGAHGDLPPDKIKALSVHLRHRVLELVPKVREAGARGGTSMADTAGQVGKDMGRAILELDPADLGSRPW